MNINGSKILSELTEVNNQLNTSDIYKLIDLIDISNHIYLTVWYCKIQSDRLPD